MDATRRRRVRIAYHDARTGPAGRLAAGAKGTRCGPPMT